jgi:hypothetical protein
VQLPELGEQQPLEAQLAQLPAPQLEAQRVQLPELGEQQPLEAQPVRQSVQQPEVQRELRRQELGLRLHQNPNQ